MAESAKQAAKKLGFETDPQYCVSTIPVKIWVKNSDLQIDNATYAGNVTVARSAYDLAKEGGAEAKQAAAEKDLTDLVTSAVACDQAVRIEQNGSELKITLAHYYSVANLKCVVSPAMKVAADQSAHLQAQAKQWYAESLRQGGEWARQADQLREVAQDEAATQLRKLADALSERK